MKGLTPNQSVYYEAIIEHIEHFHSFPTFEELGLAVGVNANASYEMVARLVRKGFIEEWRKGNFRVKGAIFVPTFPRNVAIRSNI